ncbi:MAG: GIY-YIG nuclease family protein, partial [Candidatus Paceibacteria bacterium]
MRYWVYVIVSVSHKSRYVGVTTNLNKRLLEHNSGRCRYTKGRMPWKLAYSEQFDTLDDARKREIFLKSGQG